MTDAADAAPAADLGGEVGETVAAAQSAAEALDAAIPAADGSGGGRTAAEQSILDGDLPAEQAVFDRGYVESIRGEARNYREQLREAQTNAEQWADYRSSLERYEENDRAVWKNMMDTWATDPNAAADLMERIVAGVRGEEPMTADAATDPGAIDAAAAETGLTAEQVTQIINDQLSAREAAQAKQAEVNKIFDGLKDAGFDPQSPEGMSILWRANNETKGDLDAAIKAHQAYRQSIIDEYVAGRATGARPIATSADGVPATEQAEIANLDDAFAAAKAFLDGQQDGRSIA